MDIDENSYVVLGHNRAMWRTTPNKEAKRKKLPLGIDDTMLLFYVKGHGKINLDKLHEMPLIVTSEMYTPEFRGTLHPYILFGMDRAMKLLK